MREFFAPYAPFAGLAGTHLCTAMASGAIRPADSVRSIGGMDTEVNKTDEEWREELSPDRYHVLREKGTEPPFTGAYTHRKETGIYNCGACGNELFSSDTKFDSGTGWPSFTEPAVARTCAWRRTTASS